MQLDRNDLQNIATLLIIASEKGLIKIDAYETVGLLYKKLQYLLSLETEENTK